MAKLYDMARLLYKLIILCKVALLSYKITEPKDATNNKNLYKKTWHLYIDRISCIFKF